MLELKEYIKSYVAEGKPVINEGFQEYIDNLEKRVAPFNTMKQMQNW